MPSALSHEETLNNSAWRLACLIAMVWLCRVLGAESVAGHLVKMGSVFAVVVPLPSGKCLRGILRSAELFAVLLTWRESVLTVGAMPETSERAAIDAQQARLRDLSVTVPDDQINRIINVALSRFYESPIRDFARLLVERRVLAQLNGARIAASK